MNDRISGVDYALATTVSCDKVISIAFRARGLWMRYSETDSDNLPLQPGLGIFM